MALAKKNPYPEISDYFGQYHNWELLKMPSGEVVYVVPGHPERVFVPSLSNATGRVVLRDNPTRADQAQALQDQQTQRAIEQQQLQDQAAKQQLKNQSPLGQLLPIGAGTAGIIAAAQLAPKAAADPVSAAMARQIEAQTAAKFGGTVAPGIGTTTADAAAQGAFLGPGGSATGAGAELAPIAPTLPLPEAGIASYLGPAAIAAAALYTGNEAYNAFNAGSGQGLMGGMSAGRKSAGPFGYLSLIPSEFGALGGLLGHKKIAQQRAENWASLADQGITGATQAYDVSQNLGDLSGKITSGPHMGEKWNFKDALDQARADPTQFLGVLGNYKTFGNDWEAYDPATKAKITSALINANLYDSEHGDVVITDEAKARQIKDDVLKGFQVGAPAMSAPVTPAQAAAQGSMARAAMGDNRQIMPGLTPQTDLTRTVSRSPGIGLNGQRIVY